MLLETVGANGEFLSECSMGRVMNPGHDLESCWFLLDEIDHLEDNSILDNATNIYNWAQQRGWDDKYGGLLYFVDVLGLPPEQYEHDMKLWWVADEAITASLKFYCKTGEEKFFKDFQRNWEYAFRVFHDPEFGEWYGYLRRDGAPTEPPCKGSTYKGPFHLCRMLMNVDEMLAKLLNEHS